MSIIGLFIVQYQFLNIGLNLAKVQFRQKVERFSSMIKEDFKDKNQLSFLIVQTFSNDDYFTLGKDSLQVASRNFLNDFLKDRLLKNKIDQQSVEIANLQTQHVNDEVKTIHKIKEMEEQLKDLNDFKIKAFTIFSC